MDTERCRALLYTLEAGSLSAAADGLGYTPSGLSRMMAALEEECGFPLLLRGKSGVRATRECRMLLPAFQELARQGENCRQQCGRIRGVETGSITVGTAYNGYYRALARLISEFGQQYPGIQVQLVEGTSSWLCGLVQQGRADLCVVSRREGRFDFVPLCRDQLVAWVPKGHAAVRQGCVTLEALAREPFIQVFPGQETDNSRFFARHAMTPNLRYTVHDVLGACAMVEAGLGITLVNGMLACVGKGAVETLPLDPPQWVDIGAALPAKRELSPAAEQFVRLALPRLRVQGAACGITAFHKEGGGDCGG